jgi:2,3-bisphosphoglycerate-dependent phosphoglycerate mutase
MHTHTTSVVLIRHAQSEWNLLGRFTGWADPPLTEAGVLEARRAAGLLLQQGLRFDIAYTSRLVRARETAERVLRGSGNGEVPLVADWRLNERHYGGLEGEDKEAVAAAAGLQQVARWRRGYQDQPPALAGDDPRHPTRDPRWRDVDPVRLPAAESLADTRARVTAFWREAAAPRIARGERLLVSSHGNTLRALLMELTGMGVAEVEAFEIPTGRPIRADFARDGRLLDWRYLEACDLRAA